MGAERKLQQVDLDLEQVSAEQQGVHARELHTMQRMISECQASVQAERSANAVQLQKRDEELKQLQRQLQEEQHQRLTGFKDMSLAIADHRGSTEKDRAALATRL